MDEGYFFICNWLKAKLGQLFLRFNNLIHDFLLKNHHFYSIKLTSKYKVACGAQKFNFMYVFMHILRKRYTFKNFNFCFTRLKWKKIPNSMGKKVPNSRVIFLEIDIVNKKYKTPRHKFLNKIYSNDMLTEIYILWGCILSLEALLTS